MCSRSLSLISLAILCLLIDPTVQTSTPDGDAIATPAAVGTPQAGSSASGDGGSSKGSAQCTGCALQPGDLISYDASDPMSVTYITETVLKNTYYVVEGSSTDTSFSFETKEVTTAVDPSATDDGGVTVSASNMTWEWGGTVLTWPTTYYVYTVLDGCGSSSTAVAIPSGEGSSHVPGINLSKCTTKPGPIPVSQIPSQTPAKRFEQPRRDSAAVAATDPPPFPTLNPRQDTGNTSYSYNASQHTTVAQLTQVTLTGRSFTSRKNSQAYLAPAHTSTRSQGGGGGEASLTAQPAIPPPASGSGVMAESTVRSPTETTADPGLGQILSSIAAMLSSPSAAPNEDPSKADNNPPASNNDPPVSTTNPPASSNDPGTPDTDPPGASPPVLTVASSAVTAQPNSVFVIAPGATLSPGGPELTVAGTTYSLGPSASIAVVNGATQTLAPGPSPAAPPVLTVGTQAYTQATISGTPQVILGPGTTLLPGGPAVTLGSGTTLSLNPAGNTAVVNGATQALSPPAAITAAGAPTPTQTPVLTVGGQPITAAISDGTTQFVLAPGTTLSPGGPALTLSGTTYSLPSPSPGSGPGSGSIVLINGATSTLGGASPPTTQAPVLTIGGHTVTAAIVAGTTEYVVAPGTTLTPGGTVTVSGTTYSLPAASTTGSGSGAGASVGSVLLVNGATSTIPSAASTDSGSGRGKAAGTVTTAGPAGPPTLTVDGTTYRPTVLGASTYWVVGGETLTPGGVVTVGGMTVGLGEGGKASVVVINGETSTVRTAAGSGEGGGGAASTGLGGFVATGIGGGGSEGVGGMRAVVQRGSLLGNLGLSVLLFFSGFL